MGYCLRLDFLFLILRKGIFRTNFGMTAPEFLISPERSSWVSCGGLAFETIGSVCIAQQLVYNMVPGTTLALFKVFGCLAFVFVVLFWLWLWVFVSVFGFVCFLGSFRYGFGFQFLVLIVCFSVGFGVGFCLCCYGFVSDVAISVSALILFFCHVGIEEDGTPDAAAVRYLSS